MANNPQAQYSPRRRADKLVQFDSVRNLPTIVFTKQVGETPLKTSVAEVIGNTLDTLAYDIDMSNKTLNVVLTRSNTGTTRGHIQISAKTCEQTGERVQNLDVMELMLNLGPMRNARDEGDLIKTLMHETIHYVQYQSGIMAETLDGRKWVTSWNVTRASEISRRAQGVRSFVTEKPIHPQAGDRIETLVPAPRGRGEYCHARYLATPQERQAWTQVLGLAHQLYPQAVEACRKSAREARTKPARVLNGRVILFR
jgi:hypothetical protein